MGQKVHPIGFRLGYTKTWDSRWFAEGTEYGRLLLEDIELREELKNRLSHAGIAKVEIERAANKLKVTIHASRPGIVIGRKGSEVEKLRDTIQKRTGREVYVNIQEITKPEINAQLVAENIATQLERRVAFRRAMRKTLESTVRFGAQGVKLRCAGRLNGAEIARSEWYSEGRMPLHTLRADIDYGEATSKTTYGTIGVRVWIYQGDTTPDQRYAAPTRLV